MLTLLMIFPWISRVVFLNTTWKYTSLLTLLLLPLLWQQAVQHPHICFPVPMLSHWEGTMTCFFLRNIFLYNRLALNKKVACSLTPKPSNNSYKCNLHMRTIQNGNFFSREQRAPSQGIGSAIWIFILYHDTPGSDSMMTKKTLLTTILGHIFYLCNEKKVLYISLSFRKTACGKLESLCVIHYWKLID